MPILPIIAATSPTLAESMRACQLRAGFSRLPVTNPFVLGIPKAWLGTAYHKVLEHLPEIAAAGAHASTLVDSLWAEEISRLEQRARNHPLDQRFGLAIYWRGYYLTLETLRLRVAQLSAAIDTTEPALVQAEDTHPQDLREEEFLAFGGKLKGKPDLGKPDEIVDFKTGSIYETDDLEDPVVLKAAYVRQLRIYAFLLHAKTGRWVRRGLLYPVAGAPVEVTLDPAECTREATEAVALLDRYNQSAAAAADVAALATPSPEACKWCPFKLICNAFWEEVTDQWADVLNGNVVRGRLASTPQLIHGNTAFSLTVAVAGGTVPPASIDLAPFPAAFHPGLSQLSAEDKIRIVGLSKRKDGNLYPTQRTVVVAESALPPFVP